MINKLSVLFTLLSLPNTLANRREHFSLRTNHTENSRFNLNTTLVLNKYKIYHKYVSVCLKNDALKKYYIK